MVNRIRLIVFLIVTAGVSGCSIIFAVETPVPALHYPAPDGSTSKMVVFLPGFAEGPEQFENNDFIRLLQERYPSVSAVAMDTHLGYYKKGMLADRVIGETIEPAIAEGYDTIVVVGLSMGGYGALWTSDSIPGDVDGIVLMAPYLGDIDAPKGVKEHGGMREWVASFSDELDFDEIPWIWADGLIYGDRGNPQIVLAYGDADRLKPNASVLEKHLPREHVFTNDGPHKWTAWTPLWSDIMESGVLTMLE